jgi:hypothetical protein
MNKLANYEEVKDRLKRLHSLAKDARIITEIADHSDDWNRVVMKACLYEGDVLVSTGFAMDWKGKDNQANRTNWVEVCETSAVGRCIANSRYQDPKALRPSREEMEVAKERQGVSKEIVADVKNAVTEIAEAHPLVQLISKHNMSDACVSNFFGERGWIGADQTWRDATPEKLDQVYARAKENPEGFIKAIA